VYVYLDLNSCLVFFIAELLRWLIINFAGGRRDQVRNCHMTQDQDKGHCYACSNRIKHPDGSCYKAGHFVHILCYHNN
jgi:hypothetical protein